MNVRLFFLLVAVSLVFLLVFFVLQFFTFSDNKLHVVFCDVGQGDAIFIRTPKGSDILIDAGPTNKVLGCLERHMPFWDRDIELAFATHPDADHITGFQYVLRNYIVKSFNTSQKSNDTKVFQEINRLIAEKHVPFKYLFQGDIYKTADGVELKTFWPSHEYVDASTVSSDTNSFSLVQLLSYGHFKALFTGDIEKEILNSIFQNGLSVDVFKLPHHGSKTGVDEKTFQLIHAKLGVLSVGLRNRYGHPHPVVIKLLKKFHMPFLSTSKQGDIEIISDRKNVNVL